jgi:hypothetical protein
VFHVDGPKLASNAFALESGHVKPLAELKAFEVAATFHKNRHSALVGTGLDVWLIQNGIQKLIISGIRTEQCCETTTRHAWDLGWRVDYCLDATLTWDMQHLDGSVLTAADIKARTAAVLKDRFATICSVQQALAGAKGKDASTWRGDDVAASPPSKAYVSCRDLSRHVYLRAHNERAIALILIKIDNVVFMHHQLMSASHSAADATWEIRVSKPVNLLVNQQPQVDGRCRVVPCDPRLNGIQVVKVFRATNHSPRLTAH